jgi:protein-glutamine gamma-glutamyltransferase
VNESGILSRQKIASLLITQALVIMPLLLHLPFWIGILWFLIAIWRWQSLIKNWPLLNSRITNTLAIACAIGLYINFSGRVGIDAALGLLACTFVLKILEIRSIRDGQLIIFIGFLTTATQFLLSQTMSAAFYALICCGFLISSWQRLYLNRTKSIKEIFKRNLSVLIQSIPIMLILFLIIPRFPPLWVMPTKKAPTTGFSDELSPGDLSQLVRNYEAAFRVSFLSNEPPESRELYWRGLILDDFNGRTWRAADKDRIVKSNNNSGSSKLLSYQIILEPHGHHWLFSLDRPTKINSNQSSVGITQQGLAKSHDLVRERLQYEVTSDLQYSINNPSSNTEAEKNLQLPVNTNPQTLAMVKIWIEHQLTAQQIISEMQNKIANEFHYTLQPPALGQDSVDDFLFKTKQGFCEHFASSFAFVMRSAGIPARVIVGYQGGTWNDIENYLLVSQADAHAWVEVWINNHWQRIDPTASVAPNRIEAGIDQALTQDDQVLLSRRWQKTPWLWQLQKRWDAAGYNWQKFVLNYDNQYREDLLNSILGKHSPWYLALAFLGSAIIAVILLMLVLRFKNRAIYLEQEKVVILLEKKLIKRGYNRHPGETTSAFCNRVAKEEPQLRQQLMLISREVEKSIYASTDLNLYQLKKLIRVLKA